MTRSTDLPTQSPPPTNGSGKPPGKSTMRDVAKLAGVSLATVSMVLSNSPRISRTTSAKVRAIIDQVGYRPNRLAQSLSGQYTNVLAILLPPLRHAFADAYFGELISGISDRAHKMQLKLMLEIAKPDFIKERRHIDLFERRFVDGVLALGFNDRHAFIEDFVEGGYAVTVVNNHFESWDLDYVVCDYRAGAQQAMSYLMQLGHRRIGLIAGAPETRTQRDVVAVYRERMAENALPTPETYVRDGRFTEEGGAAAAAEILERHPEVTALFSTNDKMALGAMHQVQRRGKRVPNDISIIGFDDLKHMAFVRPSLTTVHLPLYEVGLTACERLVERVHGRTERISETLPTHLVVRESTAMAPLG